ncbi:hypothetical protein [Ferrimonas balearica]|uniref:hypothetical protein n=1 Tax=Ferrimonas balearica TaxID=44012 RepID=UPI001C98EAAD|nr:hypothetical protein [Ferrimonas balearica]MBY5992501.1 hypothetical protein [Ferrimonas balearica]
MLKQIKVTLDAFEVNGQRLSSGTFQAHLSAPDYDAAEGVIIPCSIEAPIQADGTAELHLWPNTMGNNDTTYTFSIRGGCQSVSFSKVQVPDSLGDTVKLRELLPLQPQNPNVAFITDAPQDGSQYARQDGGWSVVTGGGGGIGEAPNDGEYYARHNQQWQKFDPLGEAPIDSQKYAREDGTWVVVREGVQEAPVDTNLYARHNGQWEPFHPFEDAPADQKPYGRKNGDWSVLDFVGHPPNEDKVYNYHGQGHGWSEAMNAKHVGFSYYADPDDQVIAAGAPAVITIDTTNGQQINGQPTSDHPVVSNLFNETTNMMEFAGDSEQMWILHFDCEVQLGGNNSCAIWFEWSDSTNFSNPLVMDEDDSVRFKTRPQTLPTTLSIETTFFETKGLPPSFVRVVCYGEGNVTLRNKRIKMVRLW